MTVDKDEIRAFFQQECDALDLSLPGDVIDKLLLYLSELKKWNRKINLIGKAHEKEIIEKHFVDSLLLLPHVQKCPTPTLLDVGSGAGFPGLVLKVVYPALALTLAEPRQKRVSFLRHIIRTLELDQVKIIPDRIETGDNQLETAYPIITSRALSTVYEFLALIEHYSPKGGLVICMKGPKAQEEIKEWQTLPQSAFALHNITEYRLPLSGGIRNIVTFKKG